MSDARTERQGAGPRAGHEPLRRDGERVTVLFLVTEDWYFWSHRLPVARAARDAGARVIVATRVEKLRELSPLWEMYKDGVDLSAIRWAAH